MWWSKCSAGFWVCKWASLHGGLQPEQREMLETPSTGRPTPLVPQIQNLNARHCLTQRAKESGMQRCDGMGHSHVPDLHLVAFTGNLQSKTPWILGKAWCKEERGDKPPLGGWSTSLMPLLLVICRDYLLSCLVEGKNKSWVKEVTMYRSPNVLMSSSFDLY